MALVTVTESASATGVFARDGSACGLRRGGDARDLAPGGEAGLQQLVVLRSGEEMPAGVQPHGVTDDLSGKAVALVEW
jgi:hypothetical protein